MLDDYLLLGVNNFTRFQQALTGAVSLHGWRHVGSTSLKRIYFREFVHGTIGCTVQHWLLPWQEGSSEPYLKHTYSGGSGVDEVQVVDISF